jgi:hypothetical protein
VVNGLDPRQTLARRLRALRDQWPEKKVNQAQLAAALGGGGNRPVSVPSVSSWESQTNPKVPPDSRIQDIATFFASRRSFDGQVGRLLSLDELTIQERAEREKLLQELTLLRKEAKDAANAAGPPLQRADAPDAAAPLMPRPYRFRDGEDATIVCAQLPPLMLEKNAYSDPANPDYIELYRYSDLDSLLEVFGHMRATNPNSLVRYQSAGDLVPDDYTGHLVPLGGVDWNKATRSVLDRLQLPVRQVGDWDKPGGAYFEVTEEDGSKAAYRPVLDDSGALVEDVALFAWAVNPYNRRRFVTICNGMYGRGTYGAVRALTDARFRDPNMGYIQDRFANTEAFCILMRVTVENAQTLTPDWTLPETRLFEWSRSQ